MRLIGAASLPVCHDCRHLLHCLLRSCQLLRSFLRGLDPPLKLPSSHCCRNPPLAASCSRNSASETATSPKSSSAAMGICQSQSDDQGIARPDQIQPVPAQPQVEHSHAYKCLAPYLQPHEPGPGHNMASPPSDLHLGTV